MSVTDLTPENRRVMVGCTASISCKVTDELANTLAGSDLTTLKLTLKDRGSGTVINSRNAQNVLNTNNVVVASSGVITWTMQPADNAIVGTPGSGRLEPHIALLEWTWASGVKVGKDEFQIDVQQVT